MFFKKKITPDQAKDTGLAMVLILLLVSLSKRPDILTVSTIAVLALLMIYPACFTPLGRLWFTFSELLGGIMSNILLSLVFFLVVTPIGLIRRKQGADAMRLNNWKQDEGSVFKDREKTFTADDLKKPY